jgi:DNA-binding transcriptional MerR regulator
MEARLYTAAQAAQKLGVSPEELTAWTESDHLDAVISKAGVHRYFSDDVDRLDVGALRDKIEAAEAEALQTALERKVEHEHVSSLQTQEQRSQAAVRLRRSRAAGTLAAPSAVAAAAWLTTSTAMMWFFALPILLVMAMAIPIVVVESSNQTHATLGSRWTERLWDQGAWAVVMLSLLVMVPTSLIRGLEANNLPQSQEVAKSLQEVPTASASLRDQVVSVRAACGEPDARARVLEGEHYLHVQREATDDLNDRLSDVYASAVAACANDR